MKKLIFIFTIVCLAAISFVGCSDKDTPVEPSIKLASAGTETTITEEGATAESSISSQGGKLIITVDANIDWQADIENGQWCAITSEKDGKLEIEVSQNKSDEIRIAHISLSAKDKSNGANASVVITQGAAAHPDLSIQLQGEDNEIVFPEDGGEYTVAVNAANGWTVSTDARWCTIQENHEDNTFTVSVVENHTFTLFQGTLIIRTGSGNNEATIELPISQKCVGNAMIMTVKVGALTENVAALPFNKNDGVVNCIVDWGDGTMQHVCYGYPQHEYAQAGTYKIRILGNVYSFKASNLDYFGDNYKNCIIGVDHWGNIGLTLLKDGFYKCTALEYLAEPEEDSFEKVTSFYQTFWSCSSLDNLPSGLFKNVPKATTMYSIFSGCESLRAIPDGLFSGCSKVTTFFRAFWHAFALKSIGKDVFKGCTATKDIGQIFLGCTGITSVPSDIFDDLVNLTNVGYTFSGCTELSCESPYTMVDGEKVHLYERINHTDIFKSLPAEGTSVKGCFENCTKMLDYSKLETELPVWLNK